MFRIDRAILYCESAKFNSPSSVTCSKVQFSFRFKDYERSAVLFSAHVTRRLVCRVREGVSKHTTTKEKRKRRRFPRRRHPRPRTPKRRKRKHKDCYEGTWRLGVTLIGIPDSESCARGRRRSEKERERERDGGRKERGRKDERNFPCSNFFPSDGPPLRLCTASL